MPTYTAKCPACEHVQTYYKTVANRADTPECDECKTKTEKVLDAVACSAMGLTSGSFNVTSPIDGTQIHGRTEYFAHMKKHGVVPQSDLAGQAEHAKKQADKQNKADIRKAAEDAYRIVKNK